MARLNFNMCVLCAACLSLVASVPLATKRSSDFKKLDKLPDKFLNSQQQIGGLKKDSGHQLPSKLEDTTDSVEESDGSGGSEGTDLSSITDRMLNTEDFSPNQRADVDYDSMDLPNSERLIPTADPESVLDTLAFKEMHERAQMMRKTEVKESILSKLRLLAPPNITALKIANKLKYPGHIVPTLEKPSDFQKDDSRVRQDDFHAKISTVIQFASDCKQPN